MVSSYNPTSYAMLYYVMMNVTIQKYNIYPICRESGDGWFVSEWSGHLNVSCIGAWPRPALTKLTKLRPILCKVLLVSDVYPHFIFIPLTRGHYTIQYNTIQYNTIRSPLPQSKLEECCFLDKCIFSLIFSKKDSTKNSYIS